MIVFVFVVLLAAQWALLYPRPFAANRSAVATSLVHVFLWAMVGEMAAATSGDYGLAVLIPLLAPAIVSSMARLESGDVSR